MGIRDLELIPFIFLAKVTTFKSTVRYLSVAEGLETFPVFVIILSVVLWILQALQNVSKQEVNTALKSLSN